MPTAAMRDDDTTWDASTARCLRPRKAEGVDLAVRIPEPELMDTAEQARAYAAADFTEPHEAFVARFRERFPSFVAGRVLDLGCGAADVTVRFARAYPNVRVFGVDGARAMLDEGVRLVERAGLDERITLEQLRLPNQSLAGAGYDAVISNSLLHHLADARVLWNTVVMCARPGAPVFVMDLRRPPTTVAAQQLVDTYAAGESPVLRDDFYRSLCAAYTPDEVRSQLDGAGLARFRVDPIDDRHLVAYGAITP
jgi:SAM-dependent methyltransferase